MIGRKKDLPAKTPDPRCVPNYASLRYLNAARIGHIWSYLEACDGQVRVCTTCGDRERLVATLELKMVWKAEPQPTP